MFEDRTVVGFVEEVSILNGKELKLKARIDTGATKSSIDEDILEKLKNVEDAGTTTVNSSHGKSERKVVTLKIKIEGKEIEEEFTVFNRSHMTYPMLIGQNVLKHDFVIDPKRGSEK